MLLLCLLTLRPCTFAVYPSPSCGTRVDSPHCRSGAFVEVTSPRGLRFVSCLVASRCLRTVAEVGSPNIGQGQNGPLTWVVNWKWKGKDRNREKEKKSLSKKFVHSISYFKRLTNLISRQVTCVYSMSNIQNFLQFYLVQSFVLTSRVYVRHARIIEKHSESLLLYIYIYIYIWIWNFCKACQHTTIISVNWTYARFKLYCTSSPRRSVCNIHGSWNFIAIEKSVQTIISSPRFSLLITSNTTQLMPSPL